MAFDAHTNLAIATVAIAPSPASSGTTLGVGAGEGARFPAVPFNATVWPADQLPSPTTAEVVRVTARTTDTFTITRVQENTTARPIVAGDLMAATITAKTLTDIESGTNFPLLTTPGAVTVGGDVVTSKAGVIRTNTNPGADDGYLLFQSTGAVSATRGAYFAMYGNQIAGAAGQLTFVAGDAAPGIITFNAGNAERVRFHRSGGVSVGTTTDPGTFNLLVAPGTDIDGQAHAKITPGYLKLGVTGVAAAWAVSFHNPNGLVGSITLTGTTTTYGTTSDARLKTDHGRHTDPDVLRRTVIHDFVWKSDGTPGRGVFAQEATSVAPFAVSVGGDEVDESGRLKNPWGVDYSKYVPDLITGWQDHDDRIAAAFTRINALELLVVQAQLAAVTPAPYRSGHGGSMMLQRVRDWMDRIRGWLFPQESPCV